MRTRTLFLAASILIQSILLLAQNQVSVMPVLTPPYSIYLNDYQGSLMVNLTNLTADPIEVKLVGSLSGDNGYSARTNSNYSPASPIHLGGLETKVLYANSPELDFIDLNNLQVNAPEQIQNAVIQTGILPEGNYGLCIQAWDYYTNEVLSPDAPMGCLFFNISNVQPPMLTFPWCNSTVDTEWPVFTWSPPIGNVNMANIVYDLYILALHPGQNTTDAMWLAIDANAGDLILRTDLMVPSYAWEPYDPSLKTSTTYAVAVVARDITNMSMIENKGRSEVCTFTIAPPPTDPEVPGPLTPGGITSQYNPNIHAQLPFGIINNTRIKGRLVYKFKESAGEECPDPYKRQEDKGEGVVILPAAPGGQGAATTTAGVLLGGGQDQTTTSVSDLMGAYNFSQGTPGSVWPGIYQAPFLAPGMPDTLPPEYKWLDPTPVSTAGGKPMKNIPIRLVERILLTREDYLNPWDDNTTTFRWIYGVDPLPVWPEYAEGVKLETWIEGRTLYQGKTGPNGEFEFFYHQPANTGVPIPKGEDNWADVVRLQTQGLNTEDIGLTPTTMFKPDGRQVVLMLEVMSPYYSSPDLEIYAQPGDDVELPEQACYVRSYNLETTVKQSQCKYQMGGSGSPLANVDVKVMRKVGAPTAIPRDEGQDADELVLMPGLGNIPLVSRCKTNIANGAALFKNLVSHDPKTRDDYLLEFSTDKDRGLYNYGTVEKVYPNKPNVQPALGAYSTDIPLHNKNFEVKTYGLSIDMAPELPRVLGRVMVSAIQPLANAQVKLELRYDSPGQGESPLLITGCRDSDVFPLAVPLTKERTINTDENGYFEFSDIGIKGTDNGIFLGPHARIHVSKPGYEPASRPLPRVRVWYSGQAPPSPGTERTMDLRMGAQWDMTVGILLEPSGVVKGIVQNEDGDPVKCDVQVGDGPWGRTKTTFVPGSGMAPGKLVEVFEVAAPSSYGFSGAGSQEVRMLPLSDQYFPYNGITYIESHSPTGRADDLGTFVVKEKRHRLRVELRSPDGNPVAGASVRVDERPLTSDANGVAYFEFLTPETEFRLKVTSGNFQQVNSLIVNDVTPNPVTMTLELVPGMQLAGKVTEMGGQPITGARVWVVIGADQYGPQMNQTTTGANGEFLLTGVDNGYFTVYAAKYDPQISYIGTSQAVGAPTATPSMVPPYTKQYKLPYTILKLERATDMDLTKIYGFPVEVTKRVKNSDGSYTLNGAFVKLPSNANFHLEDPAQRIIFSQIKVKAGSPNAQGVPQAVPVSGAVKTDMTHVPLKLFNGLDVTLKGVQNSTGYPLGITVQSIQVGSTERETQFGMTAHIPQLGGGVRGTVSSELSTFNFSYNFTGRFYLGTGPEQPLLTAFQSGGEYPQRSFNLMTLNAAGKPANAEFSLRGFEARSDRTRSFVEPDVFRIATVLQVKDIPDIEPAMLELEVGEIRVSKETIEGLSGGGQKIKFKLNNWSFESTSPWSFNSGIASIVIPTGTLDMVAATADVKQILIRPKKLEMDVKNLGEVRLGGVAPVVPKDSVPWIFGYDPGYVFQGHTGVWRLGALTTGKRKVASIQGPPQLKPSQLALSSFSMVSRGDPLAEVMPLQYRYYNIMDMVPVGTFAVAPDGVIIPMSCSMAIAGMPETDGDFSFYKDGEKVASRLKPLGVTVQTSGGVKFVWDDSTPSAQKISDGNFTSYGTFWIPPKAGKFEESDKPLRVRGILNHKAGRTDIKLIKVNEEGFSGNQKQAIKLGGSEEKKMLLDSGMQVMRGLYTGWDELGFRGTLAGMEGIDDDPKNALTFIAKGAIDLDEGTVIMDSLDTPFGQLKMSFDFPNARMTGSLELNNVNFAAVVIDSAQLGLLVDREGFLLHCLSSYVTVNAAPPPFQHYQVRFLIGGHNHIPQGILDAISDGMRLKYLPEPLDKGKIAGLYIHGALTLVDIEAPEIDLGFFYTSAYAYCGVEARMWVDLSDGFNFGLGGLAYADAGVMFGVRPLPPAPGCGIKLNISVQVDFQAALVDDVFTISACGSLKPTATICLVDCEFLLAAEAIVDTEGNFSLKRIDVPCEERLKPKEK